MTTQGRCAWRVKLSRPLGLREADAGWSGDVVADRLKAEFSFQEKQVGGRSGRGRPLLAMGRVSLRTDPRENRLT